MTWTEDEALYFNEVVRNNFAQLRGFAATLCGGQERGDSFFPEAISQIELLRQDLLTDPQKLKVALYKIVRDVCRYHCNDNQPSVPNLGRITRLQAVLLLPMDYREAWASVLFGEFSHSEVSDILGCSSGVVKLRLAMAAKELRKRLAPFEDKYAAEWAHLLAGTFLATGSPEWRQAFTEAVGDLCHMALASPALSRQHAKISKLRDERPDLMDPHKNQNFPVASFTAIAGEILRLTAYGSGELETHRSMLHEICPTGLTMSSPLDKRKSSPRSLRPVPRGPSKPSGRGPR